MRASATVEGGRKERRARRRRQITQPGREGLLETRSERHWHVRDAVAVNSHVRGPRKLDQRQRIACRLAEDPSAKNRMQLGCALIE